MPPPTGPLIALVDDETSLRETVAFALGREGYRVVQFADGLAAWRSFEQTLPDLAVLDILMPEMDGLELCRRLRSLSERLPILFLTSRDEELDRVLGLELGADDYLCKPFSMRELAARVKVLLRRAKMRAEPEAGGAGRRLERGRLRLDLDRYQAVLAEVPIALTVTEFTLLHALVLHPGHVKTRAQLIAAAYPNDAYVSDRTIDSHVKRLRRKLTGADPSFTPIETVYGLGYRWGGAE
ncbi:MAG TPA: response regulator transcription factor [Thermoanaerobaculia bacterium]|jgi:DNA-binding response OmpR family regulator|nr:response regulator transcription factor [Thermoanaerobaculia bacterium]